LTISVGVGRTSEILYFGDMINPFIDAHVHLNAPFQEDLENAVADGARFVSINTDVPDFIPIDEQFEVARSLRDAYPHAVRFVSTFSFTDWETEKWLGETIELIGQSLEHGAVGIKIWKNLGMDVKDSEGNFLMIDDDRLDPLFNFLEAEQVLVLGHQGEPRNCWLPLDEMTVNSDRAYFGNHPEYHMFLHPENPSHEDQMRARDRRLAKNPELRFVGLHLFSLEYDIQEVAVRLNQFPNSLTDVAERVCHLQLQAKDNRDAVRDFMIAFQDRIMYGTDVIHNTSIPSIADHFSTLWKRHWDFFATNAEQTAPEFDGSFTGLNLPSDVLEKFFYTNAAKIYQFNHH